MYGTGHNNAALQTIQGTCAGAYRLDLWHELKTKWSERISGEKAVPQSDAGFITKRKTDAMAGVLLLGVHSNCTKYLPISSPYAHCRSYVVIGPPTTRLGMGAG